MDQIDTAGMDTIVFMPLAPLGHNSVDQRELDEDGLFDSRHNGAVIEAKTGEPVGMLRGLIRVTDAAGVTWLYAAALTSRAVADDIAAGTRFCSMSMGDVDTRWERGRMLVIGGIVHAVILTEPAGCPWPALAWPNPAIGA